MIALGMKFKNLQILVEGNAGMILPLVCGNIMSMHRWKSSEVGTELLLYVHLRAPRTDLLFSCSAIGLTG